MSDICKIPQSFVDTIKQGELTSLAKNYAELGIDAFMTEGLGKDIPIVSSIVALIKTKNNISNFLLLKKVVAFLNGIADIPFEKRSKMIEEIDSSSKFKKKVGEQLLFIIDHCEDDVKAEYISFLFMAFLNKKIEYSEFIKGSSIINRLNIFDFDRFISMDYTPKVDDSEFIGVGLMFVYNEEVEIYENDGNWRDPPSSQYGVKGGYANVALTNIGELLKNIYND